MSNVAALILAAGRSSRFGAASETSKLLCLLDGKPLVCHVLEAALGSRAHTIVVVTGQAATAVQAALASSYDEADGLRPDIHFVHNPAFATGMASSLQIGLAAVGADRAGVVVLLADMPRITGAIIDRLIARFDEEGGRVDAIVPIRHERQGNPVLLGRSIFSSIATLEGDQGARKILAEAGRKVLTCEIDDQAIEQDVDTPESLARLLAQPSSHKS